MDNGEQYPFISYKNVRSALDMLLYTASAQRTNPLHKLLIIDVFLTNPDLPPGPHTREFALHQILTSIISENYSQLRNIFGLHPPELNIPLKTAIIELSIDFRQGSTELFGWSLLCYRYVRTDLNISFDALGEELYVDSRTLRRHLQFAITQLTEKLIDMEWNARTQQRKRRLTTELPIMVPALLIGRSDAFRQVEVILSNPEPHHFQVTGPVGIGKTTFVQEVMRRQIDIDGVEHLIWIYRPESVQFVRHYLNERLLPESSTIDLREYTLMHRVAVVLDDIELLQEEQTALEELLDYLSASMVFFTSRTHVVLRNSTPHIALMELSEKETLSLMQATVNTNIEKNSYTLLDSAFAIAKISGGNPLAIKLMAQFPMFYATNPSILDEIFAQLYNRVNSRLKRAWFMFALFPPGPVRLTKLSKLWPSWIDITDISSLMRHHLIEMGSEDARTYVLMSSARNFIEKQYECEAEVRSIIDDLVENLKNTAEAAIAIEVIEHILLNNWLDINQELRLLWISTYWREGGKLGHWSNWCRIIEMQVRLMEARMEFQLAYGICLRHLSEWADAERILQEVIEQSGHRGLFEEQAQALLELGILFRYQGFYERTTAILTRIENLLERVPDPHLVEDLRLEHAQLAIDNGDGQLALHHLKEVQLKTARVALLLSEAYLLVGRWEYCNEFANQAIEASPGWGQVEARAYNIMGRNWEQQGDWQFALHYFGLALTIMEQQNDLFGLARTQANLGALLIGLEDYEEARQLLRRAEKIQTRLTDRPALAVTQHNLRLLEITASKPIGRLHIKS